MLFLLIRNFNVFWDKTLSLLILIRMLLDYDQKEPFSNPFQVEIPEISNSEVTKQDVDNYKSISNSSYKNLH
ncbi:unnamed protein product [Blepharisma stoltei]|uniref:Uncharacterized protein n=1 Tax=Blepharisma stoltei TaxID=1481888 RepID=A0AAU9K8H3_9CILI|nr:unnamed protein product [Blepharisma stoltei]